MNGESCIRHRDPAPLPLVIGQPSNVSGVGNGSCAPSDAMDCGGLHRAIGRFASCTVDQGGGCVECRSNQKDGTDPPSWDPEAKTFSFFLHKPGRERVLCIL